MAVLNQLTVSGTTYDLNDKRISTTAVTTATHLLTCNSGVTSIAPITAANLASVLGALDVETVSSGSIEDDKFRYSGRWYLTVAVEGADGIMMLETLRASSSRILQKKYMLTTRQVFIRTVASTSETFSEWKEL